MRNVSEVLKAGMCSGCGLCAKNSQAMQIDKIGYFRPREPINDTISNKACPGRQISHCNDEAPYNLLWGPLLSCELGYATEERIRHQGSSGGVLTALLVYLLESKCVDGVIQIGVSEDNPIRNATYIHTRKEEVINCAGSRYSPSSPLSVVRDLIGDGKVYALVGKPCDIAAMRALVNEFPQYQTQFPYLLTFICAGVPSEAGTQAVLKQFGVREKDLISFRYRGDGWPGLTKAVTREGQNYTMTYNESWGTILNRHLQSRCKLCADGIGEAADIVCGDAWHSSENGYPSFDEQEGRSLTLARTLQGRALLDAALQTKAIVLTPYQLEELVQIQPFQVNRKQTAQVRRLAVGLLGGKSPKYLRYRLWTLALSSGLRVNLKAFIGTLVRKFKGRI